MKQSKHQQNQKKQQYGYTLIELMIGSVLGLFIMAGVFTLYSSNKNTMRLQNSMSEIQKNGRFLVDRLTTNIQNGGYSGFYQTLTFGLENALVTPANARWNLAFPVYGYDNITGARAGIPSITSGTDMVLLKSMTNIVGLVSTSSATAMSVNVNSGFIAGDMIIATDQDKASIFEAISVDTTTVGQSDITISASTTPTPGNSATLVNFFGTDAQVGKLESIAYFLSTGSNGRSALFEGRLRRDPLTLVVNFDTKELVSEVENMQVVYGLDTDDDQNVDLYGTATTLTSNNQWPLVRNIGITLLLASGSDNILSAANSYSYSNTRHTFTKDATAITGSDKRLRRVFTMHVAMPNM